MIFVWHHNRFLDGSLTVVKIEFFFASCGAGMSEYCINLCPLPFLFPTQHTAERKRERIAHTMLISPPFYFSNAQIPLSSCSACFSVRLAALSQVMWIFLMPSPSCTVELVRGAYFLSFLTNNQQLAISIACELDNVRRLERQRAGDRERGACACWCDGQ